MCLLKLVRDSGFALTKTIVYTDALVACLQHCFAIRWELPGTVCVCSRNQKSQEENKHLLPMTCNVKADEVVCSLHYSWKLYCSVKQTILWKEITYCACLSFSNGSPHVQFRDLTGFLYTLFFFFLMLILYKGPLTATWTGVNYKKLVEILSTPQNS